MRPSRQIFLLVSAVLMSSWLQAQKDERRQVSRFQAGISALPIFDFFNQVPQNKIGGVALTGNLGCFLSPRLSFGVNPYYAAVANSFPTSTTRAYFVRQQMTTFGLNAYLRGYFVARLRFSAFLIASGGFGVMKETTTTDDPSRMPSFDGEFEIQPVASFFVGPGVSWNFTSSVAMEAELPIAILNFMADPHQRRDLTTLLPTVGIQFYFGKN